MADSWNKKEREKKKQKKRKDKAEKMQERKKQSGGSKSLNDMMAYVDENGVITDLPPDPARRKEINTDEIAIGVPKSVRSSPQERIRKGKVTFFNHEKGFGFIRDLATQQSIFVHANNLSEPVQENDKVSFETESGQRGPIAVNVKRIV